MSIAGSRTSARSISPGGSIHTITDIGSLAASSLGPSGANGFTTLTPQNLGVMGMEKLDIVINFWEDALAAHSLGSAQPEDAEFFREIQNLLDVAYSLQEQSELLFLDERSCLFRTHESSEKDQQDPNFDSAESFASALDQIADLREFEDFEPDDGEDFENQLYHNTYKQMDEHPIPCRVMRTELVRVACDNGEFLKDYASYSHPNCVIPFRISCKAALRPPCLPPLVQGPSLLKMGRRHRSPNSDGLDVFRRQRSQGFHSRI